MTEFTTEERYRIHLALDRIIAARQGPSSATGSARTWQYYCRVEELWRKLNEQINE